MTTKAKIVAGIVLADFSALTAYAVATYGYVGFFEALLSSLPGWVVLTDLSIALGLVLTWMWRDARERGTSFLPYAALTLTLGSVGPLLYLILRREPASVPATERRLAASVA